MKAIEKAASRQRPRGWPFFCIRCNKLHLFAVFSAMKRDYVIMWWIIDIIAARDLAALGAVMAAVAVLGMLLMLLIPFLS